MNGVLISHGESAIIVLILVTTALILLVKK